MHDSFPYAIIWIIAVLSAACRAVRDDDFRHARNLIGLAATSGFVALGIACLLDYLTGNSRIDYGFGRGLYLGLAALAGALAKEQEAIAKAVLSKIVGPKNE